MKKYDVEVGYIKYHLKYYLENFKVSFKTMIEYKANLLCIVFDSFFNFLVVSLFGFVMFEFVLDSMAFTYGQYLLFMYLLNVYLDTVGMFWYSSKHSLDTMIKNGELSLLFVKPMNKFFGFLFKKGFNTVPFFIIDGLFFIPLILFLVDFNISIFTLLCAILLLILLMMLGIIFVKFLESFCWIFIEARKILLINFYLNGIQHNLSRFPMLFFKENLFILIPLSGLPFYYISMWVIPLLTGGGFEVKLYEITMLSLISIISIIGITINWRYSLKRYEAYG